MKKIMILGAVGLLTAMALAGCRNNKHSADSESGSGKTVIRVGTWEGDEAYKRHQKIAEEYMKKHKDVTIKVESVPDQYGTKILTQIAGGDAPDVFQVGDGDVSMFKDRGALENLDSYIKGDKGINTGDFFDKILEVGNIDGSYYTLPKDYSTLAVYYNKDMFDKAGIAYPTDEWTWDEFEEMAKKLTIKSGDNYEQWGVELPSAEIRPILPFLYAQGGDVISEDGKTVNGFMNSEGTKAGLKFFDKLLNEDKVAPSSVDTDAFKGADLFLSKKVAMNISGVWPSSSYADSDLKFGIAKLPKGSAGQFSTIYYSGYGLYSGSKHKEEAWEYLRYFSTEGQKIIAKDGLMTAYKPAVKASKQDEDPTKAKFIESLENIKMFPERLNFNFGKTAGTEFLNVLTEITTNGDGKLDIDKMLDEAAKKGQKAMDAANKE
ncbi:ABC transporter substrate-binding protein [Enterococcus sp. DIV0086]|uniref:ABC transporter substrate-binding protein n=1 Tax=Enterococcus sp. DIV0086 TaxID=2774655 RepID=UPI003D2DA444